MTRRSKMQTILQLVLILMISTACNLSTDAPTRIPNSTATPTPEIIETPAATNLSSGPTVLPLSGLAATNVGAPNVGQTTVPVTSAPSTGGLCDVLTTYSGRDPNNFLSLRDAPSVNGRQLFRVPNNAQVLLIPNTQEIEGDGYHWLNVVYVESPQMRYQGWMARDSYSLRGVRDTTVVTLRPTGAQASC